MSSSGRTFLVPRRPDVRAEGAVQSNVAFLGTAPGWLARVSREWQLDAVGNPGAGRFTLRVVGPPNGPPLAYDGPVEEAAAAAMFAASCWKLFLTRYPVAPGWRLDCFHVGHEGLSLAHGPAVGPVPRWCGREVTGDAAYDELSLSRSERSA